MKISIIVPVFNSENTITRAIQSIQNQDFGDWECIVINDGSTDRTPDILAELAAADKRIRVTNNERNIGVSASRNLGLKMATGEYISFLDSDDYLHPNFFSYCINILEEKKCDWVKTFYRAWRNDGTDSYWGFEPKERLTTSWELKLAFKDLKHDFGHCCGQMIRKSMLSDMQFDESLSMAEDQLFSMELLCRNLRIYISGEYFYNYQKRNDDYSLSKKGFQNKQNVLTYLNSLRKMLDKYKVPAEMHNRLLSYATISLDRHYKKERTDIVICYVDGTDKAWLEEFQKTAIKFGLPSGEDGDFTTRYCQDDTLKFVLRSIDVNMPFIKEEGGLIHLVVFGNTQVPSWINEKQIHIVRHKDFIPECFRPLFNSSSIELFLHNIPGLAERFIYFNDDMFVFSPVKRTELFDGEKPRVKFIKSLISKNNRNKAWLQSFVNAYALGIKPRPFSGRIFYLHPPHTALPMTKRTGYAVWKNYSTELKSSITPYRDRRNINQYVFASYGLAHGLYSPQMTISHGYTSDNTPNIREILAGMAQQNKQFVCINGVPNATKENKEIVKSWLEKHFPKRSHYEKD